MSALMGACLFAFAAALLFALVVNGWRQHFTDAMNAKPTVSVERDEPMLTLIIPARNAAETLPALLQDIHAQRYPKERTEVLVIDDGSEDNTTTFVRDMMRMWPQLRVLKGDGVGKKAAITQGVREATGALIILTDADARCGADRVRRIAAHWRATNADLVLLPVRTEGLGGFLGQVQEDEQAALLAAGAASAIGGSPLLANGANMAFTKEAFIAVHGYDGDRFASGDDMFLLERMKRAGKHISFLLDREVMVTVEAERVVAAFWQQRLRWAGKMRAIRGAGTWVGVLGLLLPWFLVFASGWSVPHVHIGQGLLRITLLIASAWLLWLLSVIGLVREAKKFLGQKHSAFATALSLFMFSVYAPVVAVVSMFARPVWKGRRL